MNKGRQKLTLVSLGTLLLGMLTPGWSLASDVQRDPTRPFNMVSVSGVKANTNLKLDSVLISSRRKLAVVNGHALQEQEWFGDVKIVKIFPERVEVVYQGKPVTLRLINPIRKEKKVKG